MHLARVPTAILYDEEGKVSTTMFRASMPTSVLSPLRASYQLVACGAEAVAAGAGNIERSRDKLAHFKMQLHPTFNTSTKPWPFRKSMLSISCKNWGRPLTKSACRSQAGPTPKDLRRLPQLLTVAYPIFLAGSYRTGCMV